VVGSRCVVDRNWSDIVVVVSMVVVVWWQYVKLPVDLFQCVKLSVVSHGLPGLKSGQEMERLV
jgi:hypothetical protein